jgi:G3E family GTPase
LSAAQALPFHIVTGFLGAGKTTLLNALLRDPALAGALVIVNEFGEIGLDHWLYEALEGEVALLSSGCLCCALRGDLVERLRDLLARRDSGALPPFSRVVIETSGFADPAPILHALIADPELARRLRLAGVVTVVDAVNGAATLAAHPEARRQLALADLVMFAKRDLVADVSTLEARARAINPAARFVERIEAGDFLDERLVSPAPFRASKMSAHGVGARAFGFSGEAPIDEASLPLFFAALHRLAGPRLLRVKGLLLTRADTSRPLVVQGAQHLMHPPRRLDRWPFDPPGTRLVVIVDGVAEAEIAALWRALRGMPDIDRPDLAALTDNPLAPRAGGLFG